jgi:lipopolysaccharide biosynthesis glycosyltransferase
MADYEFFPTLSAKTGKPRGARARCNILTCAVLILLIGVTFVTYTIHKTEALWGGKKLWNELKSQPFTAAPHTQMTAIEICQASSRELAVAQTRYAFVTMLSENFEEYGDGTVKLGVSLRQHTSLDLIMFELQGHVIPDSIRQRQRRAGWKICTVSPIDHPMRAHFKQNRFHSAHVYTKLHAWALTEYDGVAWLDADTLVLRDPTAELFEHHLPQMQNSNLRLGAVRDHPLPDNVCHSRLGPLQVMPVFSEFNAGVLLLKPSDDTWRALKEGIDSVPHEAGRDAEQAYLNRYFENEIYELPITFNVFTIMRLCEPSVWYAHRHDFRIMHYTVSKPWSYSIATHWRQPWNLLSCWFWGVENYCALWDLL